MVDGRLPGRWQDPGDALDVADARRLVRIDTQAALVLGRCEPLACTEVALNGMLRGSALACRQGIMWLAAHTNAAN